MCLAEPGIAWVCGNMCPMRKSNGMWITASTIYINLLSLPTHRVPRLQGGHVYCSANISYDITPVILFIIDVVSVWFISSFFWLLARFQQRHFGKDTWWFNQPSGLRPPPRFSESLLGNKIMLGKTSCAGASYHRNQDFSRFLQAREGESQPNIMNKDFILSRQSTAVGCCWDGDFQGLKKKQRWGQLEAKMTRSLMEGYADTGCSQH